jgi:asparaginyl-tRNA synthetase
MDYKIRTKIRQIVIEEKVPLNRAVTILGLVRTARVSKEVAFIEVNDGSCMQNIQAVIADPKEHPVVEKILTGASVRIRGKLILSQGKGQKYEIAVDIIDLVGAADATYPLQKKRHSFEFLREIAHLRPRTNTFGAVNRIRSKLAYAIHRYFQ